ncbi:MAG TPA: DUF1501 domain-containing protein [Bdellovibrionales bacterium]|nr:DUF1501 domain-containing protein [Bdellovibrionales bacterium]
MNDLNMNRREFLQFSALGLGSMTLPIGLPAFASTLAGAPKFFIHVHLNGGADQTYFFDARPLEMTKAGLLQNYLGVEPEPWSGSNGQKTWVTSIVAPLAEFRNEMSVLNGVVMAHSFDGHVENMKYMYSGNPFGGAGYLPFLNQAASNNPLDTVVQSYVNPAIMPVPSGVSNLGATLTLSAAGARSLVGEIKNGTAIDTANPWVQYAQSRMKALGSGQGRFSLGSRNMLNAYRQAPRLANAIQKIELPAQTAENTPQTDQFLPILSEAFRRGVAQSAVLSYGDELGLDVHAASDAKLQKDKYTKAVGRVVKLLKHLKATPIDSSRSLFDVTTVLVSSEFSRTMRQDSLPIDQTGTDHNALTNSVWLFGYGIKGGQIIGASDYQSPNETLTGAHKQMDLKGLKIMGRPFDFKTMRPRTDSPESFKITDYLTFSSIVNTIYSMYGVPESNYRTLGRDLPVAPLLPGLLKT